MLDAPEITSLSDPAMRKRAVAELVDSGIVTFEPSAKLARSAGFRDSVVHSLLLNAWTLPSRERGNRLPAKGSTSRLVGSFSLPVTDLTRQFCEIDLVAKQVASCGAVLRELKNLDRIHQLTSLRALRPFGVISISNLDGGEDTCWLITYLEKGVVPAERLAFEKYHPEQKKAFVNELAQFTARGANEWFVHGDLKLRNVGFDTTQGRVSRNNSEFLYFDLESAIIGLSGIQKRRTRFGGILIEAIIEKGRMANGMLADAADLAGDLIKRLPRAYVREEFARVYVSERSNLDGSVKKAEDYIMQRAVRT